MSDILSEKTLFGCNTEICIAAFLFSIDIYVWSESNRSFFTVFSANEDSLRQDYIVLYYNEFSKHYSIIENGPQRPELVYSDCVRFWKEQEDGTGKFVALGEKQKRCLKNMDVSIDYTTEISSDSEKSDSDVDVMDVEPILSKKATETNIDSDKSDTEDIDKKRKHPKQTKQFLQHLMKIWK